MLPRSIAAQAAGPWATRPAGNPPPLTFVVWQYGKIYEQIGKQFEQDWSVKLNQIIEPNVEPQVAKLTAMYAAGDPVDVSQAPVQYLSSYIDQGIATPIDGLPGVDQYVKDFTPFTRAIAQRDGKTWGLPYFSTVWAFIYNDELLAKAGFKGKPFSSYPELIEQAKKAKRDGVSKYPILWVAGRGIRAAPRDLVQHDAQPRRRHLRQAARARSSVPGRWPARRSSGGRTRSRRSWPIRIR